MVLEDTDGDGKADKSHCFVQEKALVAPLGVSVFDNKIAVAQSPSIRPPHSPTPIPVLTVHGAAGAKANS